MKKQNEAYICGKCGSRYYSKAWTRKCEKCCKKYKSRNIKTPRILEVEFLGALKNASFSVLNVTKHAIQN